MAKRKQLGPRARRAVSLRDLAGRSSYIPVFLHVMPTSRNARGIDVIAYDRTGTEFIGVQVEALTKRNPVPLGNSLDKVMGDFWVIVNNIGKEPQTYVLLPEEVRKLAHRGEKDGRVSYWLQPKSYCVDEYFEAWGRIGRGH